MIKRLTLLTIMLNICFECFSQTEKDPLQPDSAFKKMLMELAKKRIEAFDLADTSLWSPLVDDRYFIATPSGPIATKAEVMKGLRPLSPGQTQKFNFTDVHVIKDSNTAVMSYTINETVYWRHQVEVLQPLRKTDVYIFKDGCWKIVASHETFYLSDPEIIKIDPESLSAYVGQYQLMPSLIYAITKEGNKLMIQEVGQTDKAELLPFAPGQFFKKHDWQRYWFIKDKKGKVIFVKMKEFNNNYNLEAKKII